MRLAVIQNVPDLYRPVRACHRNRSAQPMVGWLRHLRREKADTPHHLFTKNHFNRCHVSNQVEKRIEQGRSVDVLPSAEIRKSQKVTDDCTALQ